MGRCLFPRGSDVACTLCFYPDTRGLNVFRGCSPLFMRWTTRLYLARDVEVETRIGVERSCAIPSPWPRRSQTLVSARFPSHDSSARPNVSASACALPFEASMEWEPIMNFSACSYPSWTGMSAIDVASGSTGRSMGYRHVHPLDCRANPYEPWSWLQASRRTHSPCGFFALGSTHTRSHTMEFSCVAQLE